MKQSLFGAALPAVLITGFLLFPQTRGVHLVSNPPSETDNQTNDPVRYVPKMATKLGLPPPQKRSPEAPDDAMATALRQLIENNKRQSVFLERLLALTPKSKTQESQQTRKKTTPPAKNPKTSAQPSDSVIMRPAKQTTERKNSSVVVKHTDPNTNRTLVEKVTLRASSSPSKLLHRSYVENPVFQTISSGQPSSQFPAGFYPHPVGDPRTSSILTPRHPAFNVQYPYYAHSVDSKTILPVPHEYTVQYPASVHFPDVNLQHYVYANSQPPNAVSSVPHTWPNPHQHRVNSPGYSYSTQPVNIIPPDYKLPNHHVTEEHLHQNFNYPSRLQAV